MVVGGRRLGAAILRRQSIDPNAVDALPVNAAARLAVRHDTDYKPLDAHLIEFMGHHAFRDATKPVDDQAFRDWSFDA